MAAILFVLPLPAILAVPDQGVSGMGELGPDLVGPPGDQVAFHQRQAMLHRQSAVEGHRRLGPRLGPVGDIDLLFHLVLQEKTLQLSLWGTHAPLDHAQVILVQLPVLDLLVHHPQGLRRLGGDDDAACVSVDAVAQGGGEGVLFVGGPLLLLIEIGLDVGEQGVHPLVLIGVDHQAGALVQQHDLVVLI